MKHDPITFTWVQDFEEYTDFEAYVDGKLYRITFINDADPYIREVEQA